MLGLESWGFEGAEVSIWLARMFQYSPLMSRPSIQNACGFYIYYLLTPSEPSLDIELIREAEHYIYIENQFLWVPLRWVNMSDID
jgi:hypothetical protein